jgi:aminopeptidase N
MPTTSNLGFDTTRDVIGTVARVNTPDPYRLPRSAVPVRYDVELAPDLAAATFEGRVEIQVDVVEPVEELVLNAIELDVVEVRVDGSDVQWQLEPDHERLVVRPVGGRPPGRVVLVVSVSRVLNDLLRGV